MNCEHATNLISAKIDGQILTAEQVELDAHLSACAGCRTTAHVLADQDAALVRGFIPARARVEDVVVGTMKRIHRERHGSPFRIQWLNTLLSAAAGFAVALLVLQPWKPGPPPDITKVGAFPTTQNVVPVTARGGIGQLALATGQIQVLPPGQAKWQVMATGASVQPGSRIRTADNVRCEFAMADGSEIRLNGGSELVLADNRIFELARGRMWSTVKTAELPFNVAVAGATVTALGTQFDVNLEEQKATVIVVEGATQVSGQGRNTIIYPGERVEIVGGRPGQAQRTYNVLVATAWVHEILVLKGKDNAELQRRLNELLAELGHTKVKSLLETEIRSLGNHAVIPLTRYLQSGRSRAQGEDERRQMAARILEDIAEPWVITDLIDLLPHEDPIVRFHVARSLKRLTGEDLGHPADQWRADRVNVPQAAEQWRAWWSVNNNRFPATGPLKEMKEAPDPRTPPPPVHKQKA